MKHEAWSGEVETLGVHLSLAQVDLLAAYERRLAAHAVPTGMISRGDAELLWSRHLIDGIRAAPAIEDARQIADLGSGAGIPGIPLAIASPNASFTLVEPRRARAAFLEAVVDALPLPNTEVVVRKAEDVDDTFDVCTARAFSAVVGTWTAAHRLLVPGGRLIYWAGASFDRATLDGLEGLGGVSVRSGLADSGPLVIMTRQ